MANATKKDALTKAASTAMARPDYFGESLEGTETIGTDDISIPRLALAQSTSPQLKPTNGSYLEELRQGQMFNTLTGDVYGEGPLKFVVLAARVPRYNVMEKDDKGKSTTKVAERNIDPNDPRTQWGADGAKPEAVKYLDYIIWMVDSQQPIALSMKGTQLRTAKNLNGLINWRRAPIYAGIYELSVVPEKNDQGEFFNFKVVDARDEAGNVAWISREDVAMFKEQHHHWKTNTDAIHGEDEVTDAGGASDSTEPPDNGEPVDFNPADLEGGQPEKAGSI